MRVPLLAYLSLSTRLENLATYVTGSIRSDERIVFFPTIARETSNKTATIYNVPIHGWIFEPERRDKRKRAFLSLLGKAINQTTPERKTILRRRMNPFLVDNERWKTPRVRIHLDEDTHQVYRMPPSRKNGHFRDVIKIVADNKGDDAANSQQISCEAILRDTDSRRLAGVIHVLADSGLSVISDIDDTIKITNATDTKRLLSNTFLKEFRAVPGMSELYASWKKELGASFHFVSSSPWQLYEELEQFTKREGFPEATFHLKSIRPKDLSILNLFADPFKTKTAIISGIVEQFPKRKFVLVGDSGEKDPEVYGQMARSYPEQIVGVFVRNVSHDCDPTETRARMETAFTQVPRDKWYVFTDPATIKLPDGL